MSYEHGWAALNPETPPRVPRVEFDAESHWGLVRSVTTIEVEPDSPEALKVISSTSFPTTGGSMLPC